jgi:capsular polysaccharide biosynthesis protein
MKTLLTFCATMLMTLATVFGQANRTLVKSLDGHGAQTIISQFQGEVKVRETETQFIRITANIKLDNFSDEILHRLVEAGRYNIQSEMSADGKLILSMPNLQKKVIIKGTNLVERLSFELEVPKGMKLEQAILTLMDANQSM